VDFRLRSNPQCARQQQFRGARHHGVIDVVIAVQGHPDGQAKGL
jgi:hypothetical protein